MANRKVICQLRIQESIDAISGTSQVHYKHGVWNEYQVKDTAAVIKAIRNSGYGADVFQDENGVYYVSVPCDSDMW